MRRALVLLLVFAIGSPGFAGALDDLTLQKLEMALSCVNLSIADLGWDKRPISDEFRLSCVDEALDHPLALADRAVRAETEFAGDPLASARAAAAWLDLELPPDRDGGPGTSVDADGERTTAKTRGGGKPPIQARTVSRRSSAPSQDSRVSSTRFVGAPRDAAEILALLVNAYRDATQLREAAMTALSLAERRTLTESGARLYTDESEEDWDMAPVLAAARKIDVSKLAAAEVVLARAARDALAKGRVLVADVARPRAAAGARARTEPAWRSRSWTIDGLTVELGGPGSDTHDARIVLDLGGDDVYTGGSVIVDLAGNDTYCDAGSGLFDVALLVDLAGDDRYVGKNFVQGGAAFGASLLVDAAGDDRYEADQCSQGSAFFGVGMLFDLAGADAYRGARFVQGFGGTRGLGALSDLSGNDTYYAGGKYSHAPLLPENYQSLSQGFGFGLRGASASGGVGILADHAGNDVYTAEVFGQGASYWFSLGILVDSAGHDKYDLYQYGQGAGIHLSAGVLFDRAGNDGYTCNNGVAQGSGHDWGVGLLWDLAGDDAYQGSGMSQGGANANAIGILIDRSGNDSYAGWNVKNQGDSFFARGTLGLGVLLDLGGQDRYTHGGKDDSIWTRGTVGVGLDWAEAPEKKP